MTGRAQIDLRSCSSLIWNSFVTLFPSIMSREFVRYTAFFVAKSQTSQFHSKVIKQLISLKDLFWFLLLIFLLLFHGKCTSGLGWVGITGALKILALPKLAWPPPPLPPYLAHWWIWQQKVRKYDSRQLTTKRVNQHILRWKLVLEKMLTSWGG